MSASSKAATAAIAGNPLPRSVLWRDTGLVRVGSFRAHPEEADFGRAGQHLATPEFVFPRTAVRIHREDREPFVADANRVVFYNPGDQYERSEVSPEGDRCEWFGVATSAIIEARRSLGTAADTGNSAASADSNRPFDRPVATSEPRTYLAQRRLVDGLRRGEVDDLALDESVLDLLTRVLAASKRVPREAPSKAAREWVASVQEIFAERAADPWTLERLGAAVGASPFALCRAFRALTGESLHRYRTGLRLRLALERLDDPRTDLSDLAGELGYSSHSHFTAAFRRAFGITPARFRGVPRRTGGRQPLPVRETAVLGRLTP